MYKNKYPAYRTQKYIKDRLEKQVFFKKRLPESFKKDIL